MHADNTEARKAYQVKLLISHHAPVNCTNCTSAISTLGGDILCGPTPIWSWPWWTAANFSQCTDGKQTVLSLHPAFISTYTLYLHAEWARECSSILTSVIRCFFLRCYTNAAFSSTEKEGGTWLSMVVVLRSSGPRHRTDATSQTSGRLQSRMGECQMAHPVEMDCTVWEWCHSLVMVRWNCFHKILFWIIHVDYLHNVLSPSQRPSVECI